MTDYVELRNDETLKASVDFECEIFQPWLPEDMQVNTNVYGAELAYWLCEKLASKKLFCSYPQSEDWGWFLEHSTGEEIFLLCCCNSDIEGKAWHCFIRPKPKYFFHLKKSPVNLDAAEPLLGALRDILEETSAIRNIEWRRSDDI